MKYLWKIANDLICFFEYFSFFYIFFRIDFRRNSIKKNTAIISVVSIWLIGLLCGVNWNNTSLLPYTMDTFIICVVLYCMFEITAKEMIALMFGEWLIISNLETVIHMIVEHMNVKKNMLEIIIMTILSVLLWFFFLTMRKKIEFKSFRLQTKLWYIVDLIMIIITFMMEFFSYAIINKMPYSIMTDIGKTLTAIGGALIVILLMSMIYYYNSTQNYRIQKEFVEIQNEQQREYFQRLLSKEEKTRRFRHDIINDLLEMQNYCENGEYQQLKSYLDSTLGFVQNISNSSYDVGNDIINTVLNYYLLTLKDMYEIKVHGYINENVSFEQRDLCIISANLIKNAVEAIVKLENGMIDFNIEQGKEYLYIKVENTYNGKIITDKNGNVVTSKNDKKNHGVGILNIKDIVKKYDGRYVVETNKDTYCTKVFLKIIRPFKGIYDRS